MILALDNILKFLSLEYARTAEKIKYVRSLSLNHCSCHVAMASRDTLYVRARASSSF